MFKKKGIYYTMTEIQVHTNAGLDWCASMIQDGWNIFKTSTFKHF